MGVGLDRIHSSSVLSVLVSGTAATRCSWRSCYPSADYRRPDSCVVDSGSDDDFGSTNHTDR